VAKQVRADLAGLEVGKKDAVDAAGRRRSSTASPLITLMMFREKWVLELSIVMSITAASGGHIIFVCVLLLRPGEIL
jgi:hypothetical protein